MDSSQKGFSLLELMIVLAILAILYGVVMMFYSNKPLSNSRDEVRKRDIDAIAEAYTAQAADKNTYGPLTNANFAQGRLPTPPEGGEYQGLLTQNSEDFKVCAVLDAEKNKSLNCLINSDNPNCYCRSSHPDNGNGNGGHNNGGGDESPSPSPSSPPWANLVPGYAIDQSKFFQTYAVYFFDYPGFPPPPGGWDMWLSLNPDFSGDYTQTIRVFGIPDSYSQDAPLNVSYAALRSITSKYVGIASITNYPMYNNNCGKTVYWRITNYYSDSATDKKVGPTYTGVIDCNTKVGVVDPPTSWYSVYNQVTNTQIKYDPNWDFDKNGKIDWTDYWLGTFSTKFRAGGWQPPE